MQKLLNTTTTMCLLGAVALISTEVMATESVNKTLDADANSLVEISHLSGEATVIGWDKNQVKVEGVLGDRTEEFRFERNGRSVVIEVKVEKSNKGWGWSNNNDKGDKLTIYVPKQSRVDYDSVNADFSISDVLGGASLELINGDMRANTLAGRLRLKTVNGDIKAEKLTGELLLDSVNGDIKASHISGDDIQVTTVNGDIDVDSQASEISAETVNGDIEMNLGKVSDVKSNTVNGSIEMSMHLLEGGSLDASSVGGSISFDFQQGIEARFDIEAHAGGRIKNRLTDDPVQKAKYGPNRSLEFATGNASATVDISTVSGRITLASK
ncbi:MAG: DUF4097 family beta strand repeat-containing protein [Glaciecola sp.]